MLEGTIGKATKYIIMLFHTIETRLHYFQTQISGFLEHTNTNGQQLMR
jgi:hypothetical protein